VPARGRSAVAAVALVAVVALAGCSGSSASSTSVTRLPAAQVLAAAKAAASGAGTVHVTGEQGGVSLDLRVGHEVATGTVTEAGLTAQLLRVGGRTYLKGDKEFWDGTAGAGTGDALAGKWVVAGGASDTAGLSSFTDLGRLMSLVLSPTGTLSLAGVTTIDGKPVVGLRDSGDGSVLYVAADGPPYPVTIRTPGATGPPPTFSGWGEPVTVHPPARDQVVDPGTLGG
jgi:hypothetical protein